MTNEIFEYFKIKYKESNITVVPGHWPDFKSKEEIDKWIKIMESMFNSSFKK